MKNASVSKSGRNADEQIIPTTASAETIPNWQKKIEKARKNIQGLDFSSKMRKRILLEASKRTKEKAPELTEPQKMDDLFSYLLQLAEEKAEEVEQLKLELKEKNKQIKKLQKQLKK